MYIGYDTSKTFLLGVCVGSRKSLSVQVVLSSVERGVQYDTFCSILCQELQKLPVCDCSFEGDNKQSLMLGLSTSLQRAALCPLLNCCGVSVDCHSGKVVSGAHALEAILETAFQEKGEVTKVSCLAA